MRRGLCEWSFAQGWQYTKQRNEVKVLIKMKYIQNGTHVGCAERADAVLWASLVTFWVTASILSDMV